MPVCVGLFPLVVRVGQVDEEVVGEHADAVGEDAVRRAVVVARPARAGRRSARPTPARSASAAWPCRGTSPPGRRPAKSSRSSSIDVVAEAVDDGLQPLEHLHVGQLLRGVDAARRERHLDVDARVHRRLLDRRAAAEHDQVGQATFSWPPLLAVERRPSRRAARRSPAPCGG